MDIYDYNRYITLFEPHFAVSPCEDVSEGTGKKKKRRAYGGSVRFLDSLCNLRVAQLKKLGADAPPPPTQLLAPVVIDVNKPHLNRLYAVAKRHTALIGGFCVMGVNALESEERRIILYSLFTNIDKTKARVLHGDGDPLHVLDGVLNGLDLFESSFPLAAAARFEALDLVIPL